MDSLTASIVDIATALTDQRMRSEMSIRTLDKALEAQSQNALALIQTLPAASAPGKGQVVDVVA